MALLRDLFQEFVYLEMLCCQGVKYVVVVVSDGMEIDLMV